MPIRIFSSALYQTNSTVVHTPDLVLVADPAWLPAEVAAIQRHVRRIRRGRPVYLLFTHSDFDHILGYGAFPGARTVASQAFRDNPNPDQCVADIHRFDHQHYLTRPYPMAYPHVDHVISHDGQCLQVGATTLHFWLAPGHTPDGLFTLLMPDGVWLAGDYLSDVEFPFVYHSSNEYAATLAKADALIDTHRPALLVPGHGTPTTDPAEMRRRCHTDAQYITDLHHHCTQPGQPFPIHTLAARYPHWEGMATNHDDNVRLVQTEQKGVVK